MGVLPIFFIAVFLIAFILGPFLGEDDAPGFKRADHKKRPDVGSWFAGR